MEGQARPPNRRHALAKVVTSRCAAHHRSGPRARARSEGPRPVGPGRALAQHTIRPANLPFDPAPESSIHKSVPLAPARGATDPTKCPLCAEKFHTSGAMMEHLEWHAVHAAATPEDKEAATQILQGQAQRSPWHAPYAQRPPPQRRNATRRPQKGGETQPGGLAVRPTRDPSLRGWPLLCCEPPMGRAPRTPWARHPAGTWRPSGTPRRC